MTIGIALESFFHAIHRVRYELGVSIFRGTHFVRSTPNTGGIRATPNPAATNPTTVESSFASKAICGSNPAFLNNSIELSLNKVKSLNIIKESSLNSSSFTDFLIANGWVVGTSIYKGSTEIIAFIKVSFSASGSKSVQKHKSISLFSSKRCKTRVGCCCKEKVTSGLS